MTNPLQQFSDAVRLVDLTVAAAERKWGIGRLRLLVSEEMRAKFDGAQDRWVAAVKVAQESRFAAPPLAELAKWAGVMQRAWAAMDADATQRGAEPLSVEWWEVAPDEPTDPVVCVVRSAIEGHALAARAKEDGRHVVVWTLEEVARVMKGASIVNSIKAAWPGSVVMKSARIGKFELDEIPDFGSPTDQEEAA